MNRSHLTLNGVLFVAITLFIIACSSTYTIKDREQPKESQQSNAPHVKNDQKEPKQVTKDDKSITQVEEKEIEPVVVDVLKIEQKAKPPPHLQLRGKIAKRACMGIAACMSAPNTYGGGGYMQMHPDFNTEEYDRIYENQFLKVTDKPLSTFSIDVDAASYSNMRRFLMNNSLPPKDAVRIEEMINYFTYTYKAPKNGDPFSITTEMGPCPWNNKHKLVHIGLQGMKVETLSLIHI